MRALMLSLAIALLGPQPAFAQSNTGCERMQTEEEYQKCIERSGKPRKNSPQIFGKGNSNVPAQGPLEQDLSETLPADSQKHLRNEMVKKVYAEIGEWTPEARNQEFDYEPSDAAKEDPALKADEEAAFAAAVSDYHDREEQAYEERQAGGGGVAVQGEVTGAEARQRGTSGQSRSALDILGDLAVEDPGGAGDTQTTQQGAAGSAAGPVVIAGDATMSGAQGQAGGGASSPQQSGEDSANDSNENDTVAQDTAERPEDTEEESGDAAGGAAANAGAQRTTADVFDQLEGDDEAAAANQPSEDDETSQADSTPLREDAGRNDNDADAASETDSQPVANAGTQRTAQDVFGQLNQGTSDAQDTSGTEESASRQQSQNQPSGQSDTQRASNGAPSSQGEDTSTAPSTPTRPIPPADPLSAQILAKLFDTAKAQDAEETVSSAPFEDWSDPDSSTQQAIETAAQSVLETQPDTPTQNAATQAAPSTREHAERSLEKERARLAYQTQIGVISAEEEASREADIAAQTAALASSSSTVQPSQAPPQVIKRLATLGLP